MSNCWQKQRDKRLCGICPAFTGKVPCWTIKQSACMVGCQDTDCFRCPLYGGKKKSLAVDAVFRAAENHTDQQNEAATGKSKKTTFRTRTRPFLPPKPENTLYRPDFVDKERHRVKINTSREILEGIIYVNRGIRLTDFVNSKEPNFIPITSVRVCDKDGQFQYSTEYMTVNKHDIISVVLL